MAKQNSSITGKKGEITRSERTSVSQQAELILKGIKEKTGEVIHVVISDRTTIELPANLSQAEIDERVAIYIKTHTSII